MKLGISTYALTWSIGVPGYEAPRNPLTAIGLLHLAKEQGVHLVQFADNLPLHKMSDDELMELKSTALELGITLEVGTRGTDPDHLLRYLEICQFLGSRIFRTLITVPEIGQALEDLYKVLPQFAEAEVTIGVENHGLHTTTQLVEFFQSLNSPYVGSCLDTVNSFGALETPDQVIRELVPYIVNLHIKDFDMKRVDHQMGFVILGTPAGAGRLDIPRLISDIEKEGKNPTAVLELWTPFTNTVEETVRIENEWLRESVAYLKTLNFD